MKKKRKEWKDDKYSREVDEEREDEKDYWEEILEGGREFWYNNVQNYWREELECRNFHEISHR